MNVRDAEGKTIMDRLIAKLPDAAMVMSVSIFSFCGDIDGWVSVIVAVAADRQTDTDRQTDRQSPLACWVEVFWMPLSQLIRIWDHWSVGLVLSASQFSWHNIVARNGVYDEYDAFHNFKVFFHVSDIMGVLKRPLVCFSHTLLKTVLLEISGIDRKDTVSICAILWCNIAVCGI